MKRIVANLTMVYILGIIIGLYETIGIILFFSAVCFIVICFFIGIFSTIRKLIVKNKYKILIFTICVVLGFFCTKIYNNRWNIISNNIEENNILAEVINLEKETKYQKTFKIKILNKSNARNKYVLLKINTKDKCCKEIKIGSIIVFNGELQEIEKSRNFGGFNYQEYLKSKNIYGIIKWKNGKIKNNNNKLKISTSTIRNLIIEKAYNNMNEDDANFFLALSIGYKTGLSKEIKDSFSANNLSHMLAISGMHISYMLLLVNLLLKPFKHKMKAIIIVLILLFFMQLTGNAPSVNRTCIVVILGLIAPIIYRKSDQITNLAISALFMLIQNPYSIKDVSFIFSYFATIGIIFIYPIIKGKMEIFIINRISTRSMKLKKNASVKNYIISKITNFIKETVAITIAANIVLIPIIIYNYNSMSLIFVLSNLIILPILIICVILSLIILITEFISVNLNILIYKLFSLFVNKIVLISNWLSSISIFNVLIVTPSIVSLICFYIAIILWIYFEKNKWVTNIILSHIKQFINIKKIVITFVIIIFSFSIYTIKEKNLRIYFVDVGQGDCTLIITPHNKRILIDGGGNESTDYDVGESVLQPYLLDRKIKTIDYIIISHFDSDHVKGLLYVMQNLKVKNAIISKQPEDSKNFEEFQEIVKKRNINLIEVNKGDKINIENKLIFYVISPDNSNFIKENPLNNNSIVCKLYYKNFSMLFTGDIEEIAEKRIAKEYKNSNILDATVLKVGHHGSKTSSTQDFLELIKPTIALIGVGKNNNFGHPNDGVLERIENLRRENLQNR